MKEEARKAQEAEEAKIQEELQSRCELAFTFASGLAEKIAQVPEVGGIGADGMPATSSLSHDEWDKLVGDCTHALKETEAKHAEAIEKRPWFRRARTEIEEQDPLGIEADP